MKDRTNIGGHGELQDFVPVLFLVSAKEEKGQAKQGGLMSDANKEAHGDLETQQLHGRCRSCRASVQQHHHGSKPMVVLEAVFLPMRCRYLKCFGLVQQGNEDKQEKNR